MPLNIIYQGTEIAVEDDATALIGSDAAATIRIVRPGISRKHAVASFDGDTWKIEDAGSRNGTFSDGQRVQTTVISGPTTLYLGHPTDGEAISFVPLSPTNSPTTKPDAVPVQDSMQDEIDAFVLPVDPKAAEPLPVSPEPTGPVAATRVQPMQPSVLTPIDPSHIETASAAELAALTAALRDQISSVKGLTWSVWAMIAVTAVLAVMTMFVGILGN